MGRPTVTRRGVPAVIFGLVLVSWFFVPVLFSAGEPSDALASVAAVRQATRDPSALYASDLEHWSDITPAYRQTWCELAGAPDSAQCHGNAFLAGPIALGPSWVLSLGGRPIGVDVSRIVAAVALIVGMVSIWRLLSHRSRGAPAMLTLTALALTPLAFKTVSIGQTSPLLFVSVCVGLPVASRSRRVSAVLTWVGGVAFKSSPIVLLAVLVARRRWRLVATAGVALVGLVAVAGLLAPWRTWSSYLTSSRQLSAAAGSIPHNSSVGSLVYLVGFGDVTVSGVHLSSLVGVIVALAFCVVTMRRADDTTLWALGFVAWLLISPLVWSHYLWVAVGAAAVVLSARRTVDDRRIAILPVVALLVGLPVTAGAENVFRGWALPVPLSAHFWDWYRPVALVGCATAIAVQARWASSGERRTGDTWP